MKLTSTEYEHALLGCILLDNRILEEHKIAPAMFVSPLACRAFDTIEKCRARGAVVDLRELALCMPDKAAEVASLTDVPSAANVAFYIKELQELARKRGIVKLARDVMERINSGDDSGAVFDFIDSEVIGIADSRQEGYLPLAHYLKQATDEIEYACSHKGKLTGVPTGFDGLDTRTNGWQPQTLNIIGARPGAGKTSIALNMASAAIRAGYCVGFFSAEMSGASLVKRMYADWANVDYHKLQSGFMSQQDVTGILDASSQLVETKFLLNDQPNISLRDLIADARRMHRKEGLQLLVIDYLSLLGNDKPGMVRHEQVAEISKSLKGLARELNIPIIVLSQLTREAQGERPKLSQLRDSGAVEQDADMVILLHNMGYQDDTHERIKINLIVEKYRHGSTGDIPMVFRPARMRFVEVPDKWEENNTKKH